MSIVVPAYNESRQIGASLRQILNFCERELDRWEILVVDDGSTDDTAEVVNRFPTATCLRNNRNLGKGSSVRRGILAARLDPVLFTDCDLSTPIEEALSLYQAIEDGADVAVASRRFGSGKAVQRTWHRRLMAAVFRLAVKTIALRGIHDTQCGFKMFRKEAARQVLPLQTLAGWAFDVELLVIARQNGWRVVEVPVAWKESVDSSLSALSPLSMLCDLFRIRWNRALGRYTGKKKGRIRGSEL